MTPNTVFRATSTKGVLMLQQGKIQAARHSFRTSLKCLMVMTEAASQVASKALSASSGDHAIPAIEATFLEVPCALPEYSHSPDNSFDVYSKCFVVEMDDSRIHVIHCDPTVVSATMYNMALTFHVEFLQTGRSNCLLKAASIYRKALHVLQQSMQAEMSFDCAVLAMAIWNNLGHCYAHHLDNAGVRCCRKQVRHLLTSFWECVSGNSPQIQEDFEFFYSNLIFRKQEYDDWVPMLISPAA